jgi:DNA-binding response OmpR family regulator
MKRILVIDDDRAMRHLLSEALREGGFAVETAEDGAAALARLARDSFDLLLLDVWMPRMTGLALLAELRNRGQRPRVVMLTSDDAPDTVLGAVREQAFQYLTKPVAIRDLLEVVRRALETATELPAIEVLSAKPDWLELVVPCELGVPERLQSFLAKLKADLPASVRESAGQAFRELLLNAIEWGGQLDPNRRVRISYLRFKRMLLYRIADPGQGFRLEDLAHAAVAQPTEQPFGHLEAREAKGMRPGGFGMLMAQAMADEILYSEKGNEVVFVKYLD